MPMNHPPTFNPLRFVDTGERPKPLKPPKSREARAAEIAYFRAQARNFEPGHDLEDWLAAEAEIDLADRLARP